MIDGDWLKIMIILIAALIWFTSFFTLLTYRSVKKMAEDITKTVKEIKTGLGISSKEDKK